jgi:probable HAF family extracellular repeat protein
MWMGSIIAPLRDFDAAHSRKSAISFVLRIAALCHIFLAFLVFWLTFQVPSVAQSSNRAPKRPTYKVIDLGPIKTIASDLVPGLNSLGDVVIWRQNDSQAFSPLLISGQQQLPLKIPAGYQNSFAYSLNDKRNAVGWANTTLNPVDSFSITHAFLFTPDQATDLGTLGGSWSRAYAINNQNKIVGISDLANKQQQAFQYADGKMSPLPPLPGGQSSVAFAVNDAGTVVGGSEVPHTNSVKVEVHAVVWRNGVPTDMGVLHPNSSSVAHAVNNHDEIVGTADGPERKTVFLYRDGRMQDLGIQRARAFSINDRQQIVGTQQTGEERHPHSLGFLWERGKLYDLNTCLPKSSPYQIQEAFRINNAGQILAIGVFEEQMHALLLTPVK